MITKDYSKTVKSVINTSFDFSIEEVPAVVVETPKVESSLKLPNLSVTPTPMGTFKYHQEVAKLKSQNTESYYESNPGIQLSKKDVLCDIELILDRNPNAWWNNMTIDRLLRDVLGLVLVDEDIDFYKNLGNLKYEEHAVGKN